MDRDIKFALLDNPNKPPLQVWPYELVTKQGKQEKRTLGPQNLERYQFLTYSMIQEGLYCRFCFCFADLEEIKKAGRSAEIQLVNKPFKKFARLSNYLDPHQKTAYHKKSLEKAQDFLDSVKNPIRNIEVKLDRAIAKEMEKNRKFLAPIVSTIVFTARLGLPFCGHRELTLVNSSKVLPIGRAFALISRIIILLRGSAKRSDAFCENIRKLQPEASKTAIPKMSDT